MNARIYYFTGSGNSLAVARDIASGVQAEVISIPSIISQTCSDVGCDVRVRTTNHNPVCNWGHIEF